MADVLPIAPKLEAKRAAEERRRNDFRRDLVEHGFDASMADWVFTWDIDADGNMIEGSTGLITPEAEHG